MIQTTPHKRSSVERRVDDTHELIIMAHGHLMVASSAYRDGRLALAKHMTVKAHESLSGALSEMRHIEAHFSAEELASEGQGKS